MALMERLGLGRSGVRKPPLSVLMHIPKTGGASLADGLIGSLGAERAIRLEWFDHLVAESKHVGLGRRDLVICHISGRELSYLAADFTLRTATFLRDPVERVVSNFVFWRERTPDGAFDVGGGRKIPIVDPSLDWDEDLARILAPDDVAWKWLELRDVATWQLATSLYERRGRSTGQALRSAKQRVRQMAFVGFQDTLEADYRTYCQSCLGVADPVPLPRHNASGAAKHMRELDASLRQLIETRNAADIDLYAWARARRGRSAL